MGNKNQNTQKSTGIGSSISLSICVLALVVPYFREYYSFPKHLFIDFVWLQFWQSKVGVLRNKRNNTKMNKKNNV